VHVHGDASGRQQQRVCFPQEELTADLSAAGSKPAAVRGIDDEREGINLPLVFFLSPGDSCEQSTRQRKTVPAISIAFVYSMLPSTHMSA
jgi:hypothetical protein